MQNGDTEEKSSTSQGSADDGAYPQPKCPHDLFKHLQRFVLMLLPFYFVSGSAAENVKWDPTEPASHSPRSIVPSSESPRDRPDGDLRAHAQDAAPQCAASQPKNDRMSRVHRAHVSPFTLSKKQEYYRICNKKWLNDTLIDIILHIWGLLFQLPDVFIMNTNFFNHMSMENVSRGGKEFSRGRKAEKIFTFAFFLIPWNKAGSHRVLLFVDMTTIARLNVYFMDRRRYLDSEIVRCLMHIENFFEKRRVLDRHGEVQAWEWQCSYPECVQHGGCWQCGYHLL